jgi:hypothetical protein
MKQTEEGGHATINIAYTSILIYYYIVITILGFLRYKILSKDEIPIYLTED